MASKMSEMELGERRFSLTSKNVRLLLYRRENMDAQSWNSFSVLCLLGVVHLTTPVPALLEPKCTAPPSLRETEKA